MKAVMIVPGPAGGRAEVREIDEPAAGAGQVLVRVHACGLNRGELMMLANAKSGAPQVGGIEFAGEVAAVGDGVGALRVGDRVMGLGRATLAEFATVDARALMPIPDRLSWAQAAAFPNVFVTAHDAIVSNGRLQAGETVLVNAASSGIGTAAIQIARALKAGKVIGASRTAAKLEQVRALGLTHAVTTTGISLPEAVMAATEGHGADLVIDCLGAEVFVDNLKAMALGGRLISVGRIAGKAAEVDLDWLSLRRLSVIGVTFRTRTPEESLACTAAANRDLGPLLERGEINPVVDSILPMDQIQAAHARLGSNLQVGKVVVSVASE